MFGCIVRCHLSCDGARPAIYDPGARACATGDTCIMHSPRTSGNKEQLSQIYRLQIIFVVQF